MADHLIAGCVFVREVWHQVLHYFGWQMQTLANRIGFASWWLQVRK
jgi:hypothetical protein